MAHLVYLLDGQPTIAMGDMSPGVMIVFKKPCKSQVSIMGHWASQSTIQECLLSASHRSVTVQAKGMQGEASAPGSLQPGGEGGSGAPVRQGERE